jgi:hypothetical protein
MVPFTGAATTGIARGPRSVPVAGVLPDDDVDAELLRSALRQRRHATARLASASIAPQASVDGTSTERRHSSMSLRLYYSGNVSQAALSDAPAIVAVDAQRDVSGGVGFTANVVGDPAAAIHQVWITYTGDGTNAWVSLDLAQCVVPLPAACGEPKTLDCGKAGLERRPPTIKYFVQAVNGVGLVSRNDNFGANYGIGSLLPTATRLELVSPPSSATVGDSPSVTARLTYAGGTALAGKLVAIGRRWGVALRRHRKRRQRRHQDPVAATARQLPDHGSVHRRRRVSAVVGVDAVDDQPGAGDADGACARAGHAGINIAAIWAERVRPAAGAGDVHRGRAPPARRPYSRSPITLGNAIFPPPSDCRLETTR